MRDIIRALSPSFILSFYRKYKKKQQQAHLKQQQVKNAFISKDQLIQDLIDCGIQKGESVLIHSSLSKIGYLKNGPKDLVEALFAVIGEKGNVLMPNSPNAEFQLNYIKKNSLFDVKNSVSKLGAISEYFRLLPGAKRSEHPTEPVSCIGPDAEYFTQTHFGEKTPYTKNSPFYKLTEKKGKILYIGVTFANAGTSLHLLEDAVSNFKFPVYYPTAFNVKVQKENGELKEMEIFVHDPAQSKKRKCDALIPLFEEAGVLFHSKIGKAPTLVVSADGMYETMLNAYYEKGVTMYTPKGS
jgi:aminoglycoside 3-N-acetyltransferase